MRTAICVIVRNEGRALLEWIAYHRVIGFDEVLVYDNESTDGLAEWGPRLDRAGVISYRSWPDPPPETGLGPQVPAYEHAAAHTGADWLCCLDADEYLVLEDHASVAALIRGAGAAGMPIALNWKVFGSGGAERATNRLVIDRFTRCGAITRDVNRHIKTLGPVAALRAGARVHVHGWVLAAEQYYVDATGESVTVQGSTFVTPPRWREAWVNHYIVKSREEFAEKQLRGKGSHAVGSPGKYDRTVKEYFEVYDCNEEEDRTATRLDGPLAYEISGLWRSLANF